jgi:hypothetical protein
MAYGNAAPQSVRTDTSTASQTTTLAGDTKKKPATSASMSYQLGFATAA